MTERVTTRAALDAYLVELVGGEQRARCLPFGPIDLLVDAIIAAELRIQAAEHATPVDLLRRAGQLDSIALMGTKNEVRSRPLTPTYVPATDTPTARTRD